ncbi:MAG: hypothetical protein ACO3M9_05505 [Flavobacteriaceae bacterium]
MFSKSTLFGTLIGFIVFNIIGWIFYDSLAADYFESHRINMIMGDLDILYMTLGSLIQAYALSVLYGRWCSANPSLNSGFNFGTWVGVFAGFGMNLMMYGTMQLMDIEATLVDAVWSVFFYGILGASIGWGQALSAPKKATS